MYRLVYPNSESTLSVQLERAGVPTEYIVKESTHLLAEGQKLRTRAGQTDLTFGEARRLQSDLLGIRMQLLNHVNEVARKYRIVPTPPPLSPSPSDGVKTPPPAPDDRKTPSQPSSGPAEIYLHWQQVLGSARISSMTDLEQVIARLRRQVTAELSQNRIVIIE